MLKTSGSIESTTGPGKGGVGVGGDGSDNEDHDCEHSLRGSGRAHQRTHQLARPRFWLSLMGLMLVVVLLASWSKSCQKFVKSCQKVVRRSENRQRAQKASRSENLQKTLVRRNIYRSTSPLSTKNSSFH